MGSIPNYEHLIPLILSLGYKHALYEITQNPEYLSSSKIGPLKQDPTQSSFVSDAYNIRYDRTACVHWGFIWYLIQSTESYKTTVLLSK